MTTNAMHKALPLRAIMLPLLLLIGCAGLLKQPLENRILTAYGIHTTVLVATERALVNDWISVREAEDVLAIADRAEGFLASALAAADALDAVAGEDALTLGLSLLRSLQAFLQGRTP